MSGFGFYGGKGRCFGEFQRYIECYSNANTELPSHCLPHAEDYLECLHHTKEKERMKAIKTQFLKNVEDAGKDGVSVVGATIRSANVPEALGLIEAETK